jgi:glycopeptide antibiotics resistance protein
MNTKQRKIVFALTLSYTVLILYFIFFAFGRADTLTPDKGYTFLWVPDSFFRVPGLSDLAHPTLMDAVDLGNFAAFIPFGVLLPLLYRTGFMRFMIIFILSILMVETVQALTLLGSFDINDVIQNALGAAIGFGAYRIGFRTTKLWTNIVAAGISAFVLFLGIWGVFGIVDNIFTKELAPFVAINDLQSSGDGSFQVIERTSFQISGQTVEPQFNVYSAEDKTTVTYTYSLGKRDLYFILNYGIPDHKERRGSLRISADGQEYLSASAEDQRDELGTSSVYLQGAKELTITLNGNMNMWDVGIREMKYTWD